MGHFPQQGEVWFDCFICGFTFPLSEGMRHYRKKRLVDRKCYDDIAHDDYMENLQLPTEEGRSSPQRVQNQGSGTSSGEDVKNVSLDNVIPTGALPGTVFTVPKLNGVTPIGIIVVLNGLVLDQVTSPAHNDEFSLTGTVLTTFVTVVSGDKFKVFLWYA